LIKTKKQLVTMALLFVFVPLATIFLIMKLVEGGMNVDPDSPAMSEDAIAERLKPVGQVRVVSTAGDSSSPVTVSGAQPASAGETTTEGQMTGDSESSSAGGTANAGEVVYNTACQVCHSAGLAGAPKVGDKPAWKSRIAQGSDVLYASAINGKNTMPPKGGAMSTPDNDIRSAVDFMVSKSR
jgi:cytochrome c5